jgi:hypothetical protein
MTSKSQRKKSRRISDDVLDELKIDTGTFFDLGKHLQGCLNGYQSADPSLGHCTHFALEAIWGIALAVRTDLEQGTIPTSDPEWGIAPTQPVEVPWIWVAALAEGWEGYKEGAQSLGKAFGLEGGQGKRPTINSLNDRLSQRAVAAWIWEKAKSLRKDKAKAPVEEALQMAVDKFPLSIDSIRRIWKKNGKAIKGLRPE